MDEVQQAPQAIIALRYFYEKVPEFHVIAAGSLLEFAIKSGCSCWTYFYALYVSNVFLEFLVAQPR